MTVTFKKAGEAVTSKVIQSVKKTGVKAAAAAAAAAAVTPTTQMKELRAIDKLEAPHIIPAAHASNETMMPWRGWIDRFLQDKLDADKYQTFTDTFYFMKSDPLNMQQNPFPNTKVPIGQDGTEAAYRAVSPGSQEPVDVPLHNLDDDPYDSGYFKRDTRRRYIDPEFPHPEIEQLKLDMQDSNDPEVQEAKKKLASGPASSPGNKNVFATGPSDFDSTGLRAVMAVTHAEIEKELDNHMPDHLPEPIWTKNEEELFNWYKERDLPVPIGGNWNFISKEKRVARW